MVTNLCNQDVDYLENNIPETLEDWFTGEKYLPGYHEDAFVNLAKFSRTFTVTERNFEAHNLN